jgi:hypothetical protein
MIPLAAPNFFRNLPHDLQPLLESGIFAVRTGRGDAERLLVSGIPRQIAVLALILTSDRALLVGKGLDQARINGKTFATNQTGRSAGLDNTLKHAAKNISLAKRSLRSRRSSCVLVATGRTHRCQSGIEQLRALLRAGRVDCCERDITPFAHLSILLVPKCGLQAASTKAR